MSQSSREREAEWRVVNEGEQSLRELYFRLAELFSQSQIVGREAKQKALVGARLSMLFHELGLDFGSARFMSLPPRGREIFDMATGGVRRGFVFGARGRFVGAAHVDDDLTWCG